MFRIMRSSVLGISILEVLIVLVLLVVVLAFASPSFNQANAQVDLDVAEDQVEASIYVARQTARTLQTDVVMRMHNDKRKKQNSITLAIPGLEHPPEFFAMPQETFLPENIQLVTSRRTVLFDAEGEVESPVYFSLVSKEDEEVKKRMLIE